MSGDVPIEVTDSRRAVVGSLEVRRALPRRGRRTVGPWCFADHVGPVDLSPDTGVDIAPHPHLGLQTVTWLLAGALVHRDSLGSEQVVRPGQLNLMTSGNGIAHSEESADRRSDTFHAVQLWVAQPESTRHGESAFEHHADLPAVDLDRATATVMVGDFHGEQSKARQDSPSVGVDIVAHRGTTTLALVPSFEYAIVVIDGEIDIGGASLAPGRLGYLGTSRDELALTTDGARFLLLGGEPFEPILMFWNFVARTPEEMTAAYTSWTADDGRFGTVRSALPRIPSPEPPWPVR